MDSNKKEIATEYKEFVDLANDLAQKDMAQYPLDKRSKYDTHRDRFQRHLVGMIELYEIRYGGHANLNTRLAVFKEMANWLSKHTEAEVIVIPDLQDYINANIKDLEQQLAKLSIE